MPRLPPRGTGLRTGRAGKRRKGKPRTDIQRVRRHKSKKIRLTKPKVLKASETMYKNLKTLYDMYEVYGKYLREKHTPSFEYAPLFRAQGAIDTARRFIREAIGAMS